MQRIRLRDSESKMIAIPTPNEIRAALSKPRAAKAKTAVPGAYASLGGLAQLHSVSAQSVLNCARKLSLRPALLLDSVPQWSSSDAATIGAALAKLPSTAPLKGLERFKAANKLPGQKGKK